MYVQSFNTVDAKTWRSLQDIHVITSTLYTDRHTEGQADRQADSSTPLRKFVLWGYNDNFCLKIGKKAFWEKEKILVTSIFSFSHNVFRSIFCRAVKTRDSLGKG